jgi:hypothetical protein
MLTQAAPQTMPSTVDAAPSPTAHESEDGALDKARALAHVHRIFIESFGTEPAAMQLQAMIIASLTETKRFTITEDKTKAGAVLRGYATESSSQEIHAYGSGTAVSTARGGGSSSISGSHGGFGAAASAIQDSSVNTETIDNAHAAVRLVDSDGDVIWTTVQESNGAKFKGASADVADKIAKQLVRDAEKADAEQPAAK